VCGALRFQQWFDTLVPGKKGATSCFLLVPRMRDTSVTRRDVRGVLGPHQRELHIASDAVGWLAAGYRHQPHGKASPLLVRRNETPRHTHLDDHPLRPRISNSILTWRSACRGTRWSQ
jgi:hypothetical protein